MLRLATLSDVPVILEMAIKFAATTNYKDMVESEKMKELITFLIEHKENSIIIMYGEVGFLAGLTNRILFGEAIVATDVAWWVEPEERKNGVGKQLVEAFEFWAKKMGAQLITMHCLDETVTKFYEQNGYSLYEKSFAKEL